MTRATVEFWEEITKNTVVGVLRTGYFYNCEPIMLVTVNGTTVGTECIIRNKSGKQYLTWKQVKI